MKENIKITKKMDLEFTILIRIKNTKAILQMDLWMDTEFYIRKIKLGMVFGNLVN
jgi:hypothetical protein